MAAGNIGRRIFEKDPSADPVCKIIDVKHGLRPGSTEQPAQPLPSKGKNIAFRSLGPPGNEP